MTTDEKYINRCFELAANGLGTTYPNPLVGCVIVKNDSILAEGWHRKAGEPHAERMAISRVSNPSDLIGATAYVSLEPCSHHGRTPPCADLLISSKIGRVVISNSDRNPKVSGRGIERLRNAGIQVDTDVLREQGEWINRRFFHYQRTRKPYVILKWAESSDGFIDVIRNGNLGSHQISGADSSRWVHQWRSQEQAIAVGKQTVINDNPSLTTRKWVGSDPVPVVIAFRDDVLDRKLSSRKDALWLDDLGFNPQSENPSWDEILGKLGKKEVNSLLVEGGRAVLDELLKTNQWNEIRRLVSKKKQIHQGLKAPDLGQISVAACYENADDQLFIYTSAS